MKRLVSVLLALTALVSTAVAQSVPYFPQIVTQGVVLGRLSPGAGPVEAIPKSLWLSQLIAGNFTAGSVLYAGAGGALSQSNSYLFWDYTNNRLGIGTTSPSYALHVNGQISGTSYVGVATNSIPTAGTIGETITSTVASGSAVSLTTATAANLTSLSLTAGDWNVCGVVLFTNGGSTVTTLSQAAFFTTSATLPTAPAGGWSEFGGSVTGARPGHNVTCHPVSVAATTTYYLVVKATFTTSTSTAYGYAYARRAR